MLKRSHLLDVHPQTLVMCYDSLNKHCTGAFKVVNNHTSTVHLYFIYPQLPGFILNVEQSFGLPAGQSHVICPQFSPNRYGVWEDKLIIKTSRAETHMGIIAVPAYTGVLLPPLVSFHDCEIGKTETRVFRFDSLHDYPHSFTIEHSDLDPALKISPMEGTIPVGGSLSLVVEFTPTSHQTALGRVTFRGMTIRPRTTMFQATFAGMDHPERSVFTPLLELSLSRSKSRHKGSRSQTGNNTVGSSSYNFLTSTSGFSSITHSFSISLDSDVSQDTFSTTASNSLYSGSSYSHGHSSDHSDAHRSHSSFSTFSDQSVTSDRSSRPTDSRGSADTGALSGGGTGSDRSKRKRSHRNSESRKGHSHEHRKSKDHNRDKSGRSRTGGGSTLSTLLSDSTDLSFFTSTRDSSSFLSSIVSQGTGQTTTLFGTSGFSSTTPSPFPTSSFTHTTSNAHPSSKIYSADRSSFVHSSFDTSLTPTPSGLPDSRTYSTGTGTDPSKPTDETKAILTYDVSTADDSTGHSSPQDPSLVTTQTTQADPKQIPAIQWTPSSARTSPFSIQFGGLPLSVLATSLNSSSASPQTADPNHPKPPSNTSMLFAKTQSSLASLTNSSNSMSFPTMSSTHSGVENNLTEPQLQLRAISFCKVNVSIIHEGQDVKYTERLINSLRTLFSRFGVVVSFDFRGAVSTRIRPVNPLEPPQTVVRGLLCITFQRERDAFRCIGALGERYFRYLHLQCSLGDNPKQIQPEIVKGEKIETGAHVKGQFVYTKAKFVGRH
ncbi:hypothetical protein BLNAU_5576 [Blattamonas nauphoetae]|uniref:Uncharacterized protein n=1 Tax=Blattamonas nauphoetae TaxID=2049346 RepID=A0ABQ9Y714_9EUKA|nr:hypothetical protein BLNAU_5576 [Blattamonas nauphoetae]